ncbi:unknown [Crocosphaera subtropica ATCC 51142]|uniref:DUF6671 domain-containing protein n=1 Tax=Crocosphaera subtropica (strain ATCC 51142 / BH68) TaxID=43989 RepID=B1WP10_CROS5|nr:DUF6671 family protein [Crocosphaera subtropica]ACB53189.1 unknown [Crocosphaera subtropica ATCC 51142]
MNKAKSWFKNRVCILATMHKKEKVMASLLEDKIQMKVIVPDNFNTDQFGTFTREIKRLGNQTEAARFKAQKALEITGETLAITSEGSFFPHPSIPFVSCNRELVLLLDTVNEIEIIATELSFDTNHSHTSIQTVEEALSFAKKVGFPDHGLVVMSRADPEKSEKIFKGITNKKELIDTVKITLNSSPENKAHIETDMRAMYNPTRMKVIAKTTETLINKILTTCPNCDVPGFDIVDTKPGLPCQMCHFPTTLIKSEVYQCQKCHHQEIRDYPNDLKYADPMYCNYCNP